MILDGCFWCGSYNVVKYGIRKNRFFLVQRYKCKNCHKHFTDREEEYRKHTIPDETIKHAVRLFLDGLSTRQICARLDFNVSHAIVSKWVHKFVNGPKFQINASHRQEIREKISTSLKNNIKTHKHQWSEILEKNTTLQLVSTLQERESCKCGLVKTTKVMGCD